MLVLLHQYVFLFGPLSFFPFRHPVPRVVRRFVAEVPASSVFVVLGLTPSHRRLRRATLLNALWRLAWHQSVATYLGIRSSLHQLMLIPLVGPSQGLLLPLVPF